MEPKFSSAEVLQVAINLEDEGVKFYEKYADIADVEMKEIFLSMAEDEKQHAKVFREMFASLDVSEAEENYLLDDHAQEFFATFANSEGFKNRKTGTIDSVKDALSMAIETEKITIKYYTGLIKHAKGQLNDVLTRLIEEEQKHLKRLQGLLQAVK